MPRDEYDQITEAIDATPDEDGETIKEFGDRVKKDPQGVSEDDFHRLLEFAGYLAAHVSPRHSDEAFRILNKQ